MSLAELTDVVPGKRIIYIRKSVVTSALDYAKGNPSDEVVGVFRAYDEWPFQEFIPITNILEEKGGEYKVHPQEIMDAIKDTKIIKKDSNCDVMFFHTHPNWLAYPSMTDINEAAFQGYYSIYSIKYDEFNAFYFDGIMWKPRVLCVC
jgi:proteasome lid subunit RPN8/RPN11